MRAVELDAEAVFTHPQIVAWRTLTDRENCTLDAEFEGKPVRDAMRGLMERERGEELSGPLAEFSRLLRVTAGDARRAD